MEKNSRNKRKIDKYSHRIERTEKQNMAYNQKSLIRKFFFHEKVQKLQKT